MLGLLEGLGFLAIGMIILIILFIPLICTIVLGTYFATILGLTGIVWWAFVIIFYLIIMGMIGLLS